MAIIYTYPKLTNPQGNELIVVSDVNNKNATRLITIANIASLVPGGDGCGASIVNITDSEGTPIYTPPACSPMILTSSDASVGITGIPGGIDLSASGIVPNITFSTTAGPNEPADPFLTLDIDGTPQFVNVRGKDGIEVIRFSDSIISIGTKCATTEERGGIIIGSVVQEVSPIIIPTENPAYLAVQTNENCEAFITMDFNIVPCATEFTRGGITALENSIVTTRPNPADSGVYYPIEVFGGEESECGAIVRVPSTEPYILPCAEPTVLGGIKALNNAEIPVPPPVADTGTYYPIETLTATSTQADECRAVVRIPDQSPVETEAIIEQVYNSTGSIILKGTPLHIEGTGPGPELNPSVDIANATNPALMPVSGLAAEDIGIGANGPMIISGLLRDVTTNTISGVTGAGDVIYASTVVGPSTPWLTGVQPSTESNLVQNVGIVAKYAGAGVGSIQVSAIGRTNATPNLDEGSIFVGNAANYSTELPIGVDNTVLTSNGTTASWQPKGMDLLFAAKFETTLSVTTNPPRYALPHLATASTPFEQVDFNPATGGTGGTGYDVYGFCSRPTNQNNIIRVKVNFSVLTGNQNSNDEERIMVGLHHDTTNQSGVNLDYGWQASGDREFDDLQGGDQIDQLVFYFDIPVESLLTTNGIPANAGDPCYFYLKGIYDGLVEPGTEPSIIFGRNWDVNPTTVETDNRAAGPVLIEVYEIDNSKYAVNPIPL